MLAISLFITLMSTLLCLEDGDGRRELESAKTEVEKLKSKKTSLVAEYYSLGGSRVPYQDAIMVVCDVCGVFLNASDIDDFFATHVKAKMHSNVVAVREKICQLQVYCLNDVSAISFSGSSFYLLQ